MILGSRDPERGQVAVKEIVESIGGNCQERLEFLLLDTSSDDSVRLAAQTFHNKYGDQSLYGIINNAGIGWGHSLEDTINTNYFGPRRVNEAFKKSLQTPKGRIVNVASASGPNYVNSLPASSPIKALLAEPWTIPGGIAEIDEMARNARTLLPKNEPYGASKALLNAYTVVHAKIDTDLIIHSVTPGFILTDLTAGAGATNPTSKGAVPPCFLMMDETVIPTAPTGRYFGSDCVRSPLAFYRGPGEPPYESDADLVPLPATATQMALIL